MPERLVECWCVEHDVPFFLQKFGEVDVNKVCSFAVASIPGPTLPWDYVESTA